ncbi:unnamed protein product [Mycena citricolor]|uniref:Uncharacterized protein n=1 Tax=Mycena citricolor TaxID=2018698 RepID=A0AAD2HYE6_9AGAR|nr:unnamed protein product [Mycena citricolor]
MTLILPPELVAEIVGHARTDRKTLLACSCAASSFLRPSRNVLFETVTVASAARGRGLVQLASSPWETFSASIQKLCVVMDVDSVAADTELEIFLDNVVAGLPALPSLSQLSVQDFTFGFHPASAARLERLAHITCLEITGGLFDHVWGLLGFIAAFPLLEKLAADLVFADDEVTSRQPITELACPRGLHTLSLSQHVGSVPAPFRIITEWFHSSEIRDLRIATVQRDSVGSAGALIRAISSHLRTLDIALSPHVNTAQVEQHLDLSGCTGLKSLTVHVGLRRNTTPGAPPSAIWALLRAPRSPIQTLIIVLRVDIVFLLVNFSWTDLHDLLRTKPYAELEQLRFMVHCPYDPLILQAVRAQMGLEQGQERAAGLPARQIVVEHSEVSLRRS